MPIHSEIQHKHRDLKSISFLFWQFSLLVLAGLQVSCLSKRNQLPEAQQVGPL